MTDQRLKVGFIGCGGIAKSLYTGIYAALADFAQVVAVADLVDGLAEDRRNVLRDAYRAEGYRARADADRANSDGERQKLLNKSQTALSAADYDIRKYHHYDELLNDDDVDVTCVFTPPVIRSEPIVASAEAGKHVYSEGPFAKSVEEADAIVSAVKRAGVKFHSQVVDRYPRGMVVAHHAIARGLLGELGSASVTLNDYRGQEYYGPVDEQGVFHPRKWHGTWRGEGGGAVFHHGRYIIDPFLWVVGSRVKEVFAYSGPVFRTIEHDSYTQALVKFENGAQGTIEAGLISHLSGRVPGRRGQITLLGQDASILINQEMELPDVRVYSDLTVASKTSPAAVEEIEALQAELSGYPESITQQDQTRLFLESIINDTEPLVPIEVPHHHVEVTRAIYKSAEERRPVTLPLDKDDPFYTFEGRLTGGAAVDQPLRSAPATR